jgi:heme A synthase
VAVEGGLAGIHEILGGLVVVAFIVMAILAAVAAAGRDIPWIRQWSFVASGLLLLQYLLGVLLLANRYTNTRSHIAIALLVLVPVALQHSSMRRLSSQSRAVALLIWALAAAVLSIIAYMTGLAGAGVPA